MCSKYRAAPMLTLLQAVDRWFAGLETPLVVAIAAFSVVVIAWLDYATGYYISIYVLYLAPVGMAAWYAKHHAYVLISLLASIGMLITDVAAGIPVSNPTVLAWNLLVSLASLLIFGFVLATLCRSLHVAQELARTDLLTGLFSRRAFMERFEQYLALASRQPAPLTVVYIDVDDFKYINDRYGHAEGDRVLRTIGQTLGATTRSTDTVARLGGDEFAAVFPNTNARHAQGALASLGLHLRNAVASTGLEASCSIGAVTFESPPPSVQAALSATDAVMYEAKRRGKNTMVFKVLKAR